MVTGPCNLLRSSWMFTAVRQGYGMMSIDDHVIERSTHLKYSVLPHLQGSQPLSCMDLQAVTQPEAQAVRLVNCSAL